MNCHRFQRTLVLGITLTFALGGYVCPISAAQTQPIEKFKSFAEWCLNKNNLSEAQRHTVEVLLEQVKTSDCNEANKSLSNVTELNLVNKQISDLSPLSPLSNLTSLDLGANPQISDLKPLSALTNLTFLDLSLTQISDLSPLSSLTNLTILELSNTQISDLKLLPPLTKLTRLVLSNNSISDLTPLSALTNLTWLELRSNQISDLTPLSTLTNLTRLELINNQISDLTPLSTLTSLSRLELSNNQISNLSPLSNLTNLTNLYLPNNQISNLSPLSNLTNLTDLRLPNNRISDLTPLSNLSKLDTLLLQGNEISDLSSLSNLTNLSTLYLFDNQISDLSPLSSLTNLNYLVLSNNKINDPSPLSPLTKLGWLYLENNPIAQKTCPVQPVTVCHFSDDGAELYAQAQKLYQQGQFESALATFQDVLAIYQKAGDRQRQGNVLNQMGDTYSNLGQYARAIEIYQQALSLRQPLGDSDGEITTLVSLSIIYDRIGQYQKAIEVLEPILQDTINPKTLIESRKTRIDGGRLFNSLASAYTKLGNYSEALKYTKLALTFYRKRTFDLFGDTIGYRLSTENRYREVNALDSVGMAYFRLGKPEQALIFLEKALERSREIRDKAGEGRVLNHMGDVYVSLGQTQKSLEFYQQALPLRQAANDIAGQGETLNNLGLLYFNQGQYVKSEASLFDAIKVLEALRPGLKDDEKIAIFETQTVTYRLLQKVLIAQNKFKEALEISDRGRARAFAELLADRVAPSNQAQSTPLTLEQIQRIAKEQNATLVEYSIVTLNPQSKEQPQEAALYIWVVKPTGDIAFRQVDLKSLNTSIEDFVSSIRESIGVRGRRGLGAIATANAPTQTQRLQELHQLLIEPIADLLPSDTGARVIFIPQSSLFLVPFAALQDASGKYLIEKHTILTAPSIQVLALTRQQRSRVPGSAKDVLVVGNPTMPSVPPRIGEAPQQLPSLPGAQKEAEGIAQLLSTKAFIGKDATKVAIVQKMPEARIIHLATHGLLDDFKETGVPGAIALAPDKSDNGLLTAYEIQNLKLNAELVVLSACDTGRGRITGDGVIGLSRSLIAAGVPSVIVSLWSVPDAPTESLMTEFYKNLQSNPDKAQALRQAMLTMLKQHPKPINWAAFTLIGEAN